MTPKRLVVALVVSISPLLASSSALGQTYEVPPSSSTSSSAPYISDSAMEQCVLLYNEAKWLAEELVLLERTPVDKYSQASVDAYNNKVTTHASMLSIFNRDCAGKQSESAYKAAQKLNKQDQSK